MNWIALLQVVALIGLSGTALAQTYPSKLIRIIVPTAPGNAADITTRLISERLTKRPGQPVIVENRPGGTAAGAIASSYVAKSPADGHTLLGHLHHLRKGQGPGHGWPEALRSRTS